MGERPVWPRVPGPGFPRVPGPWFPRVVLPVASTICVMRPQLFSPVTPRALKNRCVQSDPFPPVPVGCAGGVHDVRDAAGAVVAGEAAGRLVGNVDQVPVAPTAGGRDLPQRLRSPARCGVEVVTLESPRPAKAISAWDKDKQALRNPSSRAVAKRETVKTIARRSVGFARL